MKWQRSKSTGAYLAGPYTVKRSALGGRFWAVSGPGIDRSHYDTKADAQEAASEALSARLAVENGPEAVYGDVVVYDGRRGQITSIMSTDSGVPLYCILFARGKWLCVFRREFEVIEP